MPNSFTQYKVTWINGYGDNDGKSEVVDFNELRDWNLDAYLGDDWDRELLDMNVGELKKVYGPCGVEEVHYERVQ